MKPGSNLHTLWQAAVVVYVIAVATCIALLFLAPWKGVAGLLLAGGLLYVYRMVTRPSDLGVGFTAVPRVGKLGPEMGAEEQDAPPVGAVEVLRLAAERLTELSLAQWRTLQHAADRHSPGGELGYLIGALRTSAAVPFLTRINSISKRWDALFQPSGVARGRVAAAAWALEEAATIHAFLSQLYLDRIESLLKKHHEKEAAALKKITRQPMREERIAAAEGRLRQWHSYFSRPLGGLDAVFDHYRSQLHRLSDPL